nr:tRNA adenosine(34) deaminase TadA [Exilibacterium tricleocarpae]
MQQALALAERAAALGEVPVGALVVQGDRVVGRGWNQPISACDPSAHAEIVALRDAARHLENYRLPGCRLYVTIEPCGMCAGALVHARIEKLWFGALEPKAGAVVSNQGALDAAYLNHRVAYEGGLCAEACSKLIREFFQTRRTAAKRERSPGAQPGT